MGLHRSLLSHINVFARKKTYIFSSIAAGDLIYQSFEISSDPSKDRRLSWERNVKLALCGFIYFGPTMRFWYGTLDRLFAHRTFFRPLKMLIVDQGIFAPCYMVTVLFVTKLARGQDFTSISNNFAQDYPKLLSGNWKVWPWVQIVNFTIIPLRFRVLWANFIAVFWNSYVSRMSSVQHGNLKGTVTAVPS
ncbi:mpv17-like protein isoform X2 [Symsagittifera roscoffensis]|uniref:mpv17-like protein isoform X2 n=1 Tax=Symsagittifera roscoffensis TaxID=84072 RepID=UPI00307C4571